MGGQLYPAEWLEAAADRLGQVGFAGSLTAQGLIQDVPQLRLHRPPMLGGAHPEAFFQPCIDVADSECGHRGFVVIHADIIYIVSNAVNACAGNVSISYIL